MNDLAKALFNFLFTRYREFKKIYFQKIIYNTLVHVFMPVLKIKFILNFFEDSFSTFYEWNK